MNKLFDWLGQTNPNLVIPMVGAVATWLWAKAHGDKNSTWRSLIDSVLHTFMVEMLDQYLPTMDVQTFLKQARATTEKKIWTVLAKRGVPQNKTTEKWVHEAIEKSSAWLGNEAAKLRIPEQLREAVARLEQTNATLKDALKTP